MSVKRYQQILGAHFGQLLKAKTGWGRNEVMKAFDKACASALAALVDELEARPKTSDDNTLTFPNGSRVEFAPVEEEDRFRSKEAPPW